MEYDFFDGFYDVFLDDLKDELFNNSSNLSVLLISLFDRELMSCIVHRQLISLSKLLLVLPGHTAPADSTYSMYSANTFKAYAMAVASS